MFYKDTKLFYCSANGHLWYRDEDNNYQPAYYKSLDEATDEEIEAAEEKYCGCNE